MKKALVMLSIVLVLAMIYYSSNHEVFAEGKGAGDSYEVKLPVTGY